MEKCHFIGIGGIGMSGLAKIMLGKEAKVTGSDIASSYITEGLIREGAKVVFGQAKENVDPDMTVIYSSDIKKDNPEYAAAVSMQCPMIHRSELLLKLMQEKKSIAVAGTHGKTTTSALLAWTLHVAGLDPSYAVGGIIPQFESNAGHGTGEYFVAEADESDGTFLQYHPFGAIITNIGLDHLTHYGSEERLIDCFQKFLTQVTSHEHLFWCGDDARLTALNHPGISYGFSDSCALQILNPLQEGWMSRFTIDYQGNHYLNIELALVGKHNILNAAAVFGLALTLGASEESIRKAFQIFGGVWRRCQKKGEHRGVLFLDDYAHHPTEIKTTLRGIRNAIRERQLIAVFQPHRYSRTQECLGSFGGIFEDADLLIVTDIFASREAPIPGVTTEAILEEILQTRTGPTLYCPRDTLAPHLIDKLEPHDVVVSLGAGDITKLHGECTPLFPTTPISKLKIGLVMGGKSPEHTVALMSAEFFNQSIRSDLYEITHFGITKEGNWIHGPDTLDKLRANATTDEILPSTTLRELLSCDVILPVLHGPNGEDGKLQGFCEMLGLPYAGQDWCASAISMDKAHTKKLWMQEGLPTAPFTTFTQNEWTHHQEHLVSHLLKNFSFPLFVKGVHLGSSFAVRKVDSQEDLHAAITHCLTLDNKILVEAAIPTPREIEFVVLGNDWIRVLPPGEVYTNGNVHDYEGKYTASGNAATPRANLSPKLLEEGMVLAHRAYQTIGCSGMARIDFLLDQEDRFWCSEINPIPGCTPFSPFPKICAVNGLDGPQLIDWLVIWARHRKREQKAKAL